MAELQTLRPPPPPSFRTPRERAFGIGVAAVLHVGVIYVLVTSLGVVSLPSVPRVLEVFTVAPEEKNAALPPPPPPPPVELPKPVTVEPEVVIDLPQTSAPVNAITVPPPGPVAPAPAPIAAPPAPQVADKAPTAIPNTHTIPAYPPLSRRLGETGTVRLTLVVGEDGRVVDAMVEKSSGSPRLDEAAEEWVKSHWRYHPAIKDGQPVKAQMQTDVVFKLT